MKVKIWYIQNFPDISNLPKVSKKIKFKLYNN
jgi:hypothetical protein